MLDLDVNWNTAGTCNVDAVASVMYCQKFMGLSVFFSCRLCPASLQTQWMYDAMSEMSERRRAL